MPKANMTIFSSSKFAASLSFVQEKKIKIDYNQDINSIFDYIKARETPKGKKKKPANNKKQTNSRFIQEDQAHSSAASEQWQDLDRFYQPDNRYSSRHTQKKPKALKERKKSYAEDLANFILSKNLKLPQEISQQQHLKSVKSLCKILNEAEIDKDTPPYFVRLANVQEQIGSVFQIKESLGPLSLQNVYPMLLPQQSKLTKREHQRMTETFPYDGQKRRESLEKQEVKQSIDNLAEIVQQDSLGWQEKQQSSKYIVSKVVHIARHKQDLPAYLEAGLKKLQEIKSSKHMKFDSLSSLEKFNAANACVFSTLDCDYYRSMDQRNEGFSGFIRVDEEYADDVPFEEMLTELIDMLEFPPELLDTSEIEADSSAEREVRQGLEGLNGGVVSEDIRPPEERPKLVYNEEVIQYEHFRRLAKEFYDEVRQFRRHNSKILIQNKFVKEKTSRWDFYITYSHNYDESSEQHISKHSNISTIREFQTQRHTRNSHQSKSRQFVPTLSKTKTVSVQDPRSKKVFQKMNDIPQDRLKSSKRQSRPNYNEDDQNARQGRFGDE